MIPAEFSTPSLWYAYQLPVFEQISKEKYKQTYNNVGYYDAWENELSKYESYYGLLNSGLSITCGSTLGFEGLSAGKKVLFGATMDVKFIDDWGVGYYYSDIPQLISLQQESFEHFSCKVEHLREISLDDFLKITSPYARQIMNESSIGKLHELLQQKIEHHLSQNSKLDS